LKRLGCALFKARIRTAAFSIICSLVLVEPAAAGAAAKAAEQPNDIAVVFMILFGFYFTFEEGDMAAAMTLGWWL
jgi:hypothetical protein